MKQCKAKQDIYADVIPCAYMKGGATLANGGKPTAIMRCQRESGHEGDHVVRWREASTAIPGMCCDNEFSWPRR